MPDATRPARPPAAGGWHKDGSFFRHFLDSREQGLLTIVYWSDVEPQGGGTFIAPDSIKVVARYLAEHPEVGRKALQDLARDADAKKFALIAGKAARAAAKG